MINNKKYLNPQASNKTENMQVLNTHLNEEINGQLKIIKSLIKKSDNRLKKLKDIPNGKIQLSQSHGKVQYYYYEKEKNKRTYLKVSEIKKVRKFFQKDYEQRINKKLLEIEKKVEKFVNTVNLSEIYAVYDNLHESRKKFVDPIIETKMSLIENWYDEHPQMQNPFPEKGKIRTNRGEWVRSKSEKIIADALDKYGIPYQYEPMLELKNKKIIYPDFVVLNLRTNKTLYWEHLGLVSERDYAIKNFEKIQKYEENEYLVGDRLIVTMESFEKLLDVKIVEKKIEKFLI